MKLLLLVALLGVAYVAAECPEACNGHGFCGEYDKCSCYRNWQGNSCADRTCPFDLAFVDIPHGDLNMDGKLDDEITTYGAQINDIYAFEVYPTDGYQINRAATDASSDDVMYTTLTAKEKAASFYDMVEDGHFYAECSNKGMCDRKSGQCDCFDGYSGTACRRVACPNDCSGHGTCETIAETSNFAYDLWDRYKTQVCSCDPGYFGIDCAQRSCPYGDDPLSTDEYNEVQWLTLRSQGKGSNGPGTAVTDFGVSGTFRLAYLDEFGETWNTSPIKAQDYDIGAVTAAAGETANNAVAAAIKAALEGIPNSVFEEVDVELWPIQTPMGGYFACTGSVCTIGDNGTDGAAASHGAAVATVADYATTMEQTADADAAVDGLSVDGAGASTIGISSGVLTPDTGGVNKWGISNCLQTNNGGVFAKAATFAAAGTITATTDTAPSSGALCRFDLSGFRAKITFKKNPGDINELTCDADLVTSSEHADSAAPSTDIVCTAKDRLNFELGSIATLTGSTIGGGNGGQITTNMNLKTMMTHGDRLHLQGQCSDFTGTEYCWSDADCGTDVCDNVSGTGAAPLTVTIAGPIEAPTLAAASTIIVEEETAADATGLSAYNTPGSYWQGKGSTENVECSHRGLCNHDEGLCECFTGYTHDDCSMQDALNA